MTNPLTPSPSLISKLGSIITHFEELNTPGGHPFDRATITSLLHDPEVLEWMKELEKLALLPVRRK